MGAGGDCGRTINLLTNKLIRINTSKTVRQNGPAIHSQLKRSGICVTRGIRTISCDSDIKLTAQVNTDEMQLPIYDSIKNLPRLGYTQIRAQISGPEGLNGARADALNSGTGKQNHLESKGVCHVVAQPGAQSEMVGWQGLEPWTNALKGHCSTN